ncbi:hypothetical protein CTAYLR_002574 [Chrysophaeum taylorii]|uniref:Uncharacterized protein n=1 Tax=Chrysophaeum taylorii TaxID=2483200 RepID=A0AAD7XLM6_9STRA|nr:hypothetical protein CTAYLR_002574 [Chrysophaeum taylorii]
MSEDLHRAHRSGWHNMYETNMPTPVHFVPEAPEKKKPPPPPPRQKASKSLSPVEEFMEVTGVTDPNLAAQHVSAAAALGKSVRDAIRHYFEHGGMPMVARSDPVSPSGGAFEGIAGQLVEMGFERELAVRAAQACKTLEEAAEWCLREGGGRQQPRPPPRGGQPRPPPRGGEMPLPTPRMPAAPPQYQRATFSQQYPPAYNSSPPPYAQAPSSSTYQAPPAYGGSGAYPQQQQPPPPAYPQQQQQPPPPAYPQQQQQPPPPAYPRPPAPPAYSQQQPNSSSSSSGGGGGGYPQQHQPAPPPAYSQQQQQPFTFDAASQALFEVAAPPVQSRPLEETPKAPKVQMPTGGELPTPIVQATNPYGHAPMAVISMPPSGVLGGAAAAEAARKRAAAVEMGGKLFKLSGVGGRSRLGSRWQARHFVLKESRLAYGDVAADGGLKPSKEDDAMDAFSGTKKRFSLWGSYVIPEPPERSSGRENAFAVYRSDSDAFTSASVGPRVGPGEEREQLLLLAAEDATQRAKWVCALMAAAGRPGVLLRVGEDAAAVRLRCCYGSEALELEAGAVGRNVLVRKLSLSGAGAIGVKVGDELVSVNGAPVPLMSASAVSRMLEAVARPVELELRRPRDSTTAKELAAKAALSLGTDAEDESHRKERFRESIQVGEALRADALARQELRAKRVEQAQVEAAAVSDALALSSAESKTKESCDAAVAAASEAVRLSGEADQLLAARADPAAAASLYKRALDSLMAVQEPLADPDGPARQAVSRVYPDLSLANLFDHINSYGAQAADLASRPPPPSEQELGFAPPPPPLLLPDAQQLGTAVALFEYAPHEDWQLAIQTGDHLTLVSEHDDGWSDVCLADGTRGLVPSSYIQVSGRTNTV